MSSNDDKMVSVALIGCGGFSKSVQSAMAATGLYQVTTCFDVDRAAMKETAEIFGARPCDTFQQAAQADDVEAVMLITPNHLHREQTELAFAAGKHVYVEKPIANTVAEGIAMTRAARKAGKVFMVGHVTRRLP